MTRIYFTADLHLGHELVSDVRGFRMPDDHDDYLIGQLLALPKQSTIWVLGDLDRGSDREYSLDRLQEVVNTRDITMHLVAGNHDACHPMHRQAATRQREYLEVFDSVQPFAKIRHNKQDILLSHFPYEGDHTDEPRFNQWRLRDYGQPLVHGHTHQQEPVDPARPNQVCVSWDAWQRPATLHEVTTALEPT